MIDFELRPEIQSSETQRMVYEAARDFATQFIKPNVMDWDEAQYFPAEIFEQAGYDIVGQFGTHFDIRRGDDHRFFIIPINATEEYFDVLKEQVK